MPSSEGHIHWGGAPTETISYLNQTLEVTSEVVTVGQPLGALHIHAEGFVGTPLYLPNSMASAPQWDVIPGTAPTLEARQDGSDPVGYIRVRAAGSEPPAGSSVVVVPSPIITTGPITCGTASPVQIGPDLTAAATAGDRLEVGVRALCPDVGGPLYWNIATRVSGADVNFFGNGTNTWPYPQGGVSGFYTPPGLYTGPRSTSGPYTVQSGDISGGNVTVRIYAQAEASARDVLATAGQPLQTWLINYGQ